MPRLSVIVPAYNHAPYVRKRMVTILEQSFQDFELILLDDSSDDGTAEIISEFRHHPRVSHIVLNNVNSGTPFLQWKKGVDLAEGEYIWIAESDDYSSIMFLDELVGVLDENPKVSFVFSQSVSVDSFGSQEKYWSDPWTQACQDTELSVMEGAKFIQEFLIDRNVIPNASAVVFRKEAAPSLNKIENMKLNGDWFFWVMIATKGYIAFVNKPLNFFRYHSETVRSRSIPTGINWIEYIRLLNYMENQKVIEDLSRIRHRRSQVVYIYLLSLLRGNISARYLNDFLVVGVKGLIVLPLYFFRSKLRRSNSVL